MINRFLDEILSVCAEIFCVSVADVLSESRKQELVYCRKAFCVLVKEKLDIKNEIIARKLNRTDSAVTAFLYSQPNNNYYKICLNFIRQKLRRESAND